MNESIKGMSNRLGLISTNQDFMPNMERPAAFPYTDGIKTISSHLEAAGGYAQQSRMIRDKRRSMDKALKYSYQGADIRRLQQDETFSDPVRALINPNKLKQDYDDKIVSIGYENGFQVGDVFQWVSTNTLWLIYLQDLTELAYFKGAIRKCSYQIKWEDSEGNEKMAYAALRGPVETKINYIQKHEISVDEPNYSLNLLLPKNEDTLAQFYRYSRFYLQDHKTCWRVEAIDEYSTPGILEVVAVEYYANETEDDIENGIVGGLIVQEVDPNPPEINEIIVGEVFIYPKREYTYVYTYGNSVKWSFDSSLPIQIVKQEGNSITIKWTAPYRADFELKAFDYSKKIIVESLF